MMSAPLRPYQRRAVDETIAYWRRGERNPLLVLPTAAGKSRVLGALAGYTVARRGRVLVLAHRKELVVQDAAACRIMAPGADIGVMCGALGRYEVGQITVASRDTVARRLPLLGRIDLCLVDEAHISPERYRGIIAALREVRPGMQVGGLTATPYNSKQGYIFQGEDRIFDGVSASVSVRELLADGYLTPIVTGDATATIDTSKVHVRAGDFIAKELELAADIDEVTIAVARDVSEAMARGRRSAIVFGVNVGHAHHLREALGARGVAAEVVSAETPDDVRDRITADFAAGRLACVVNVDVLTTGFDAPCVDIVAIVRPTMSTVLYVQMVGRGCRLIDGAIGDLPTAEERLAAIASSAKPTCLLLDYGGNIARHGPIDNPRVREVRAKGEGGEAPVKVCPACYKQVPTGLRVCECGHEFPPPEKKANREASRLQAVGGDSTIHTGVTVGYRLHRKRGDPPGRPMVRVDYADAAGRLASEFVDVEGSGHPGGRAWKWWAARVGGEPPETAAAAVAHLVAKGARQVAWIETRPGRNGYADVTHVETA